MISPVKLMRMKRNDDLHFGINASTRSILFHHSRILNQLDFGGKEVCKWSFGAPINMVMVSGDFEEKQIVLVALNDGSLMKLVVSHKYESLHVVSELISTDLGRS